MFKDAGNEIKFWSKFIVWIFAALGAVLGLILSLALDAPGIIFHVCFMGLGGFVFYVIGYFQAIVLYAFGELVDCTKRIAESINDKKAPLD